MDGDHNVYMGSRTTKMTDKNPVDANVDAHSIVIDSPTTEQYNAIFVSMTTDNRNPRLKDGALPIDAGTAQGKQGSGTHAMPFADYEGDVRPQGNAHDVGADESGGSASNEPPARPSISSVDQITGTTAMLHSSAFSDPDGDSHAASEWQVDLVGGDFSDPVASSGVTDTDLNAWQASGLSPETTYKSRVRHRDSRGRWSDWSDPALDANDQFTTEAGTSNDPPAAPTGLRRTDLRP
jgi:hypothetical protein